MIRQEMYRLRSNEMTFALILFWEPCTSRRKKLNLILPVMLYLEFKILQHINPNTAIKVILPKKRRNYLPPEIK